MVVADRPVVRARAWRLIRSTPRRGRGAARSTAGRMPYGLAVSSVCGRVHQLSADPAVTGERAGANPSLADHRCAARPG